MTQERQAEDYTVKLFNILKIAFIPIFAIILVLGYIAFGNWVLSIDGVPLNPRPTLLPVPPVVTAIAPSTMPETTANGYQIRLDHDIQLYMSHVGSISETEMITFLFERDLGVPPTSRRGSAWISINGEDDDYRWMLVIAFPWPAEPLVEPMTYPIEWDLHFYSAPPPNTDSAGGELTGPFFSNGPSYCQMFQNGQITLTSLDPLQGEFQFFCQFDSTDYAQVSGRFWQ